MSAQNIKKNKRKKAMTTALAVIIAIVVLLIIGVAIVGLTSSNLNNFEKKANDNIDTSMKTLENYGRG